MFIMLVGGLVMLHKSISLSNYLASPVQSSREGTGFQSMSLGFPVLYGRRDVHMLQL
uniref:Uncharacterized protein n=1 Tax=Rhizophora mucronata TaxID=61149 RepID=A0A2P2Q5U3_RHIMU